MALKIRETQESHYDRRRETTKKIREAEIPGFRKNSATPERGTESGERGGGDGRRERTGI